MLEMLSRKARQIKNDPTLRRWLIARSLGRTPPEPAYVSHRPPYLQEYELPVEAPFGDWPELKSVAPTEPCDLPLPGFNLRALPNSVGALFQAEFSDTETLLALHRFAWLPILGKMANPAWVGVLWRNWAERFGAPDDSWAWHPYTAAERVINLLAFIEKHGVPEPRELTLKFLADHAPAIAKKLEYFGDHHTSNHLANNGRGLYILGASLSLPRARTMGGEILLNEAKRIFLPSGILREGSSHYHLLLLRNYLSVWRAARKYELPEADEFAQIVARLAGAMPHLLLPAGLPLIGDISPDITPAILLEQLIGAPELANIVPADAELLRQDGWLRRDVGEWSGLWHASPEGFSHMPGHGHQDCGSFELHYAGVRLFIDPGRGSYGENGLSTLYRSGAVHNLLSVDDADPYPPNKPYYDPEFRRFVGGPPPSLTKTEDGVRLSHHGFARLNGVGEAVRQWHFAGNSLIIEDRVEGKGKHQILRRLLTPFTVKEVDGAVELSGQGLRFSLKVEGLRPHIMPFSRWRAYGESAPSTAIEFVAETRLPWHGSLIVEKL
jgi:hypothetical protein